MQGVQKIFNTTKIIFRLDIRIINNYFIFTMNENKNEYFEKIDTLNVETFSKIKNDQILFSYFLITLPSIDNSFVSNPNGIIVNIIYTKNFTTFEKNEENDEILPLQFRFYLFTLCCYRTPFRNIL